MVKETNATTRNDTDYLYGDDLIKHDLRHILGYRSGDAFRQSVFRKQLPFPIFIKNGARSFRAIGR